MNLITLINFLFISNFLRRCDFFIADDHDHNHLIFKLSPEIHHRIGLFRKNHYCERLGIKSQIDFQAVALPIDHRSKFGDPRLTMQCVRWAGVPWVMICSNTEICIRWTSIYYGLTTFILTISASKRPCRRAWCSDTLVLN